MKTLRLPAVVLVLTALGATVSCGGTAEFFVGEETALTVWRPEDCAWPDCRSPAAIGIADFDGDGHRDIVAGGEDGGDLSLLLGDGKGGFDLQDPIAGVAGANVHLLATGLFDSGSVPDLAVVDTVAMEVRVLLGDGSGGFALAPGSPISLPGPGVPMRLVAAQVAGSGRDDLFLGDDQGYATILLAATNGSMSAAASSPFLMAAGSRGFALAPLDEDGVLDLAVADSSTGALLLFSGDGAGGFAPLGDPIPVGSSPLAVAAEYYDVGPTVDLAVLDAADRTVDVLLGDGEGAFEAAATSPVYLPAGEKLDLVPLVNAIAPNYSAHLLVLQQRDSGDAEVMELLNHGYADFELTAGPRRIGGVTDRIHVAPLSEDAITDLGWADFRGGVVRVAFGTPADL